jgi:hypothetical protein
VVRHLVSRGVDVNALELKTSTGSDAVGMVVAERVEIEEGALPVCPAGEVSPREPEAGATSAPRSEPTPVDELEGAPEPAPARPAPAKPKAEPKTEPTKEDAVEIELE